MEAEIGVMAYKPRSAQHGGHPQRLKGRRTPARGCSGSTALPVPRLQFVWQPSKMNPGPMCALRTHSPGKGMDG